MFCIPISGPNLARDLGQPCRLFVSQLAHTVDINTDDEDDQDTNEAADLIGSNPHDDAAHDRMKVTILEAVGLPKNDLINANDVYVLATVSAAMDGAVIFMRPCRFP